MSAISAQPHLSSISESIDRQHKRRVMALSLSALALVMYFIASWVGYDFNRAFSRWDNERAALFVLDTYAHKDHVSMEWDKLGELDVRFEGGNFTRFAELPDWVQPDGDEHVVSFPAGHEVRIGDGYVTLHRFDDTGNVYKLLRSEDGEVSVAGYEMGDPDLPAFIRWSKTNIEAKPSLYQRVMVFQRKLEVHRYQTEWAYFWFDFNSPFVGMGLFEAFGNAGASARIDPSMNNYFLVFSEIWNNDMWFHGSIVLALVETFFMATLGTLLASILGLPLAFMAAKNVNPFGFARGALRRLFDFLRGVDTLIWSLIFLRAFGPGMFTGVFAIAVTDTGTLGKLMSEAVENSERKQLDGVESTGARFTSMMRFGIVPQILPVFVSQSLYYLESNTRAAVIIGAMGAGGIGQLFISALRTGRDFEDVVYIALWVLALVIVIDMCSSALRRRLIGFSK